MVKGDQQAFSQLYDHSSTLLFTLAVRILGNHEEAAELLQDVYLEVWRKVSRYDVGRGTPVAWLITLTKSRAIDRLRARAARGYRATNSLESRNRCAGGRPQVQARLRRRPIKNCVLRSEQLWQDYPRRSNKRLNSHTTKDSPMPRSPQRLNQPLGTVKTRIKLGMSKLRDEPPTVGEPW